MDFALAHYYVTILCFFPKPQAKYYYELPRKIPNATYLIRHFYSYKKFDGNSIVPTFLANFDLKKYIYIFY